MVAAHMCGLGGHIRRGRYNGKASPTSWSTGIDGVSARPRFVFVAGAFAVRAHANDMLGSDGSCPC